MLSSISKSPLWLVLSVSFWMVNATPAATEEIPRTISVTGEGKATSPPDLGTIHTGVSNLAATAKEALAANSRDMEKVMQVLAQKNIASKDIQTSGFSVYPEYDHRARPNGESGLPPIVGYRVSNQVQVRVRNLARLGEILDALVQAGSNQISGIQFSLADAKSVMNQARSNAVDDARGRAELYAQATSSRVGKVISISEQAVAIPRPMFHERAAMATAEGMSVPVAAGEQEIAATVHIVFALLDQE